MTSKLIVNELSADTGISTITVGDNMSGVTFKTGTSNLHNVGIEIAGINVLGADTPIGAGATIYNSGDVIVGGAVTATKFYGDGSALTGLTAGQIPNLAASKITSGTVATARLGSGTASSSTFLRGDSSWAAVTQTTINNNANNKLITGSGSANTLEAEASLTFDAGLLKIDDLGGTAGKGRLEFGNGGEQYIEGFDTGNGGSGSYLAIGSNTDERLRIDSSGRLLVKESTNSTGAYGQYATLQLKGNSLNTNAAIFLLANGKNTTANSSGDHLGYIVFGDKQAGEYAYIRGTIDGGPAVGDYPGRIEFHTTADGAGSASERLRIHSNGQLELKVPDANPALKITPAGTNAPAAIDFNTPGTGPAVFKVQNSEKLRIHSTGGLKLSNTAGGSLFEYGGSTVQSTAALNITRMGNGYADIRLSSNYGASLRLAGASDNTDEYNITQDNQKNAYHNLEYDGFINFNTNNTTQAMRLQSGKVSIAKDLETLTGNGVNAKLQVASPDAYSALMIGSGYNRATIGIGGGYDLCLISNAYPANATTKGIRFYCGTSGGSGPNERFRIHQDGMLETKQHGTAKTYWFSSGTTGGYSTCTIVIDAHAYHSFVIDVSHGGYAGVWGTARYMGYENGSMYYGNEGTETTDSNSRNITHDQNPGGGHKHRIQITGGMGTHPGVQLKITIMGPDAYIDTGDIVYTWA